MIKELITRITKKYGATLTLEKTNDNFYKQEKQIATIDTFKTIFDKLNLQYDIEEKLMELKIDFTSRSKYNPDRIVIEWRNE